MTTTNTKTQTATPTVSRTGQLAWRKIMVGPKGGLTPYYCPRLADQTEPSAWAVWSERLADVSLADVVGSHDFR